MTIDKQELKVLFSEEQIQDQIGVVAKKISDDYKYSDNLVIIGVLKGALLFTADLIRKIDKDVTLEFIRLSSYGSGTESSGKVKAYDLSLPDISGKDVIITEDIIDSGRTADFLLRFLKEQANAKSIKIATLLDKPCRRLEEFKYVEPDYCCFTVDDKFIIGYGLDFDQKFRDLPYLGYVEGLS